MTLDEVIDGVKTLSPQDYKIFRDNLSQLNQEVIELRYQAMLQAFEDMGEALTDKYAERIIIENHGASSYERVVLPDVNNLLSKLKNRNQPHILNCLHQLQRQLIDNFRKALDECQDDLTEEQLAQLDWAVNYKCR